MSVPERSTPAKRSGFVPRCAIIGGIAGTLLVACLNPMPDDFPNGRGGAAGAQPGDNQTGNGGTGGTGNSYGGGAGSGGRGGSVSSGAGGGAGTGGGGGTGPVDEDEPDAGAPDTGAPDAGAPADAGDAGGGAP